MNLPRRICCSILVALALCPALAAGQNPAAQAPAAPAQAPAATENAQTPATPDKLPWARLANAPAFWPAKLHALDAEGDVLLFRTSVGSGFVQTTTRVLARRPGESNYTLLFQAFDVNGEGSSLSVEGCEVIYRHPQWEDGGRRYPLTPEGSAQWRNDLAGTDATSRIPEGVFLATADGSVVFPQLVHPQSADTPCPETAYPVFERLALMGVYKNIQRTLVTRKPLAAITREGDSLLLHAEDGSTCPLPDTTATKAHWLAEPLGGMEVQLMKPLRRWYAIRLVTRDGEELRCPSYTDEDIYLTIPDKAQEHAGQDVYTLFGHYLANCPRTTDIPTVGSFAVPKGTLQRCYLADDGIRLIYRDQTEETLPYPTENWWALFEEGDTRRLGKGALPFSYRHPQGKWLLQGNERYLLVYRPAPGAESPTPGDYTCAGTLYLPLGREVVGIEPHDLGCTLIYKDGARQRIGFVLL